MTTDQAYTLYIANKNYSSWSLRPWALMRQRGIPFTEALVRFQDEPAWQRYRATAPNAKVPCLLDGEVRVWESLSILEYLHERHAGVWPQDTRTRAWARSACAEMHAGFQALRQQCSMSCGVRVRLHEHAAGLDQDLARLTALWREGLERFGGPFLAGESFGAVDAFYAPVVFRVETYGLDLPDPAGTYVAHMLQQRSVSEWYTAALAEAFRDTEADSDIARRGEVIADLRVPVQG